MCNIPYEYYENDTSTCKKCQFPCISCVSAENCINCAEGFYLENKKCLTCSNNCLRCYDKEFCITCVSPSIYDEETKNCVIPEKEAVKDQVEDTIAEPEPIILKPKIDSDSVFGNTLNIQTFETIKDQGETLNIKITDCLLLNETKNRCVICKNGYFLSNGICRPCLEHCIKCLTLQACLKCKNSFQLTKSDISNGFTCLPSQDKVTNIFDLHH